MKEKYLTLEQNISAARIFLNTFGLILENTTDINQFSKIKIYDKDMNNVGKLYFNNGKIFITAKYNSNVLEANYNISKIFSFADKEENNALFGEWSSKILFNYQNNNGIKINGEFFIGCSIDSEFGISCLCHPLINCEVPSKGIFTLKILRNGKTFRAKIQSKSYIETIDIMPWDEWNGFISHVISKGNYNPKKYTYEYRKYAGIFTAGKGNEDKLHVFLSETEWGREISHINQFPLKNGDDNSRKLVIQKGLLMQDLDPDMFNKIKSLGKVLLIDNLSLLDNLFSVCYDSYSNEELEALLGIKRKKLNYQNGGNTLKEAYFGIGENNCFLSSEQQKKLLKSHKNKI